MNGAKQMRTPIRRIVARGLAILGLCAGALSVWPAHAASPSALGEISGRVHGTQPDALAIVFAHDAKRDVAYSVYVVDGKYRATQVLPGEYAITVRPAVGQLKGFTPQTATREVAAGGRVQADFTLGPVAALPNYVGGMPYDGDPKHPDARILPYDQVYPPGPGRVILERTCNACHAVNFLPYNVPREYSGGRAPKNRDAWAAAVDRMHKGPAFGRPGKATMFDPRLLPPADREMLIDYLAANFGEASEPRAVQLESVPPLDRKALERAMFVEYNYREPKGKYDVFPWPHQVDFDREGNVWLAYTSCCIVRFDPRTGESKAFEGHGGGHGIAVDQTDGTVWYSGDTVRRLDPKTGKVDHWKLGSDRALGSNTQVFDSQGNLWMSLLGAGGLAKWDRKADTIVWWEVPVVRSRPYGIIVDNFDKVWFADYHNGGVTRFDPQTQQFRHYPLVREDAASSIRRLGVDSRNRIWAGTWASLDYVAKLYRLDPDTGEVIEKSLAELPHAAVYNAEPDGRDNIWLSNDNYLSKYDPDADRFTHYPTPVRSDTLKTTITRDGGVWFFYRNAGKVLGYGGTAVVLYPDKDRIPTLGAWHADNNQGHRLARFRGPPAPPVRGGDRIAPAEPQNAAQYAEWVRSNGYVAEPSTAAGATVARVASATASPPAAPDAAAIAAGQRLYAANCIACHTLDRGGAHGVGPNLWGVFGSPAAGRPDYAYSPALEAAGIVWSDDALARFIGAPSRVVPGTTMAALAVTGEADRAALLAFLRARTTAASAPSPRTQQDAASQRE
jgi:cytochrome c